MGDRLVRALICQLRMAWERSRAQLTVVSRCLLLHHVLLVLMGEQLDLVVRRRQLLSRLDLRLLC